jgi:hypothetical protein
MKLMAIIVASVSVDPLHVRAVQNVLVPLVGFHDGSPDDDGESDKQNRFDDHVFDTFRPSIEDRPATVVKKIGASTGSGAINGRCDIFAASAHRLEQLERRGNDQRPFRWMSLKKLSAGPGVKAQGLRAFYADRARQFSD